MLSIDFHDDGRVRVYASQDGTTISVTADANQLPALLPAATLDTVRNLTAQLLDQIATSPRIKAVNR